MSVCPTRIGSNDDVEQQTSRLPTSDKVTITVTSTETTTRSSTLISSVEQNNEDNDDDDDGDDDDDDDFFESLRKSQSKKEDFTEEKGVTCHHHHSIIDDETTNEITTPSTIKPSIATIATAAATVTPENKNNNVVSSTISDDTSAIYGISKSLYSTTIDDHDRVDDDEDYIEPPDLTLESVVSSDSQKSAQSSLSVEMEVSAISPSQSSVPTLRLEPLMSIVDSTTSSTTPAITTTDHSKFPALIKTTTSTSTSKSTTSKATTRKEYIIPLLVIVFFGTFGWFSYQEIYSGNTSTTFITNELLVNRFGQTKYFKFSTERSQQDLNNNEVVQQQQQQQQLKVQQEMIESDQKRKRLLQENNGQNKKGIDRNNTFASWEEKEKLKGSSSPGKYTRYRPTQKGKHQEQGNMKREQMLATTVQKPVLSSSALEKDFQQQQQQSQQQTTYHQTNKKQRKRSLTLQKLQRFFVRLSFILQSFLMRIQIIIYKTGKLIGIEIKQFSGVTDQLATHARERALLAAQHVNNVTNELASTNAKIYANSHMKSGGRESITYVGKKLMNRLTRIMSRRIDNTIHFISPTQKRKMRKASTASPI
jgi:hypothetical protein